ncbi:MAG: dihydrofolate reductase family protein [Acidimicrobiales bacterium]
MRKLDVFNQISLDGYFTDTHGDMSWAHREGDRPDPEWDEFGNQNASGGGVLLFGRVTYELMAGFWPTPAAFEVQPVIAKQMNALPKIVFSHTLDKVTWENTTLISNGIEDEVRRLKAEDGPDMVIMGSGTIVAQMARADLIDSYQFVVVPIVLGAGRTLFEGIEDRFEMERTNTRAFANGNVVVTYRPMARAR